MHARGHKLGAMSYPPRPLAPPLGSPPSLDELTTDLVAGRDDSTKRLFLLYRARPPAVIWSPVEDALPYQQLRFLLTYWTGKRGGRDLAPAAAISPVEMRTALGFIMLLDVLDGGADFRYRVYGSELVERTGKDWTGHTVSDIAAVSFTGTFYAAIYRAAIARREAVATVTASPPHVAAVEWSRIVLPLTDAHGSVSRFLVGNVPGAWRPPE